MNLLLVGFPNKWYLKNFIVNLREIDPEINIELINIFNQIKYSDDIYFQTHNIKIYNPENTYLKKKILNYICFHSPILKKIFLYIFVQICLRKKIYDLCNIHFVNIEYSFLMKIFRQHSRKIITTIWGSDFYRSSEERKKIQQKIYRKSDLITTLTVKTKKDFLNFYKKISKNKIKILRFGLNSIHNIDKNFEFRNFFLEKYNINNNKIIISVGYNGQPAMQLLEIISVINDTEQYIIDKFHFIFQLTYGDKNYIEAVIYSIIKSKIKFYSIFDKELSDKEISELRIISDILITFQKSDQLSASVLEYLYAGNKLLYGSWLPYNSLKKFDIDCIPMDSIKDMKNNIIRISDTFERNKKKNMKIKKFVDPEICTKKWINLYKNKIKNNYT